MKLRYAVAGLIILLASCGHGSTIPQVQSPAGSSFRLIASPDGLSSKNVVYNYPMANGAIPSHLVKAPDGNVWVVDSNNEFVKVSPTGTMTTYPLPGGATFFPPYDRIAVGPSRTVWAAVGLSTGGTGVAKVAIANGHITMYPLPGSGDQMIGIAMGTDGDMYMADFANNVLYKLTSTGTVSTLTPPTSNSGPTAITLGSDHNIWFEESISAQFGKLTPQGIFSEYPGACGYTGDPYYDHLIAAPDGDMYNAAGNQCIIRLTTAGTASYLPGCSPLYYPYDVTVGPDRQLWFENPTTGSGHFFEFNPLTNQCSSSIVISGNDSGGIAEGADGDMWFGYNTSTGFIGVYEEKVTTIGIRLNGELSFTDPNYGFELGYAVGTSSTQTQTIRLGMGESVLFQNVDTIPHSAAFLGNATLNNAPWPGSFTGSTTQSPAGTAIGTTGWATGSLNPTKKSPIYETGLPGFYMIGDQYDYVSNNMRTVIIVH